MALLFAALLGVVQGLTEFLPVSSSAHLILARYFFGWDLEAFGLPFDVACHVGTLLAVIAYFWQDVRDMIAALPRLFSADPAARRIWLLVVGTIPAVVAALLFDDLIEHRLRTPLVAAVTLAVGAVLLLVVERVGARRRDVGEVSVGEAAGFGLAQACALVPGVSRSGATITMGMFLGYRRDAAARFSFLLGIPAILGAAAKEGLHLAKAGMTGTEATLFGIGMSVSAVVGYATVRFLMKYLTSHKLDGFAYYRLALAAAVVLWSLL